jgi:hypothetical protein
MYTSVRSTQGNSPERVSPPLGRRGRRDPLWCPATGQNDEAIVACVGDNRDGAYFEIAAEPYHALDVYYHPFAYRDFSMIEYEDSNLAA